MSKTNFKNREIQFLSEIIDEESSGTKITHPMLSILFGQISKVLIILDSEESYVSKMRQILNKIKERWNEQAD